MINESFKTSDMALAAFLITTGCSLKRTCVSEEEGRPRVDFEFEWIDRIRRLKASYFMKQAESRVIAAEYALNLKNLKNLVFEELSQWKRSRSDDLSPNSCMSGIEETS